jgi:hypothetical protein
MKKSKWTVLFLVLLSGLFFISGCSSERLKNKAKEAAARNLKQT